MKNRLNQLEILLKDDPENSFLWFAVAKEYESLGNIPKAIEYYQLLKSRDPGYIGLYYHLAKAFEAVSADDSALLIYEEGIRIANEQKDNHALSELKAAKLNLEMEL